MGRALAITSDLFSNVGVGDFPGLHFQFLLGTRVPNRSETSILSVDQPGSLVLRFSAVRQVLATFLRKPLSEPKLSLAAIADP